MAIPSLEIGSSEWHWFRHSKSSWQAVLVIRPSKSQVSVRMILVPHPIPIEKLDGQWGGKLSPPNGAGDQCVRSALTR